MGSGENNLEKQVVDEAFWNLLNPDNATEIINYSHIYIQKAKEEQRITITDQY